MATLGKISAAMKLIDEKKENLRKSFEDLQSQPPSSLPSSFSSLRWRDIDSYFTSLRSSLQHKFNLLETLKPTPDTVSSVPARPELKSLCENSDGLGLRRFIMEHRDDRSAVKEELPDAYLSAPDAAAMILDAMEGFFGSSSAGKGSELHHVRSSCLILLEVLMGLKPEVAVEVKEKAMKVASGWKEKMMKSNVKEEKELEGLGFLLLVSAYGLADGFSMDDIIDCLVVVAKRRQSVELCRAIVPADKISDLIQKLINEKLEIAAVKFSVEFEKSDEFPPVPLLKEHRSRSKRLAKRLRRSGKNLQAYNEALVKEINGLKSIIKCIDDYHLDSEYPKDPLVALVEKLENEKSRKRPAIAPAPNTQQLPKARKLLKKGRQAATNAGPTAMQNTVPRQETLLQAAGLLPDHLAQYRSSPAGPYGVAGHTPDAPYGGSTSNPYGLGGGNLGFTRNPLPPMSNLYHSELHPPPAYHDRPLSYGGYEFPPQYHPYYPQ